MTSKYISVPILNDDYYVIFVSGKRKHVQKVLKKFEYPDHDDAEVTGRIDGNRGTTFTRDGCHPVIAMPSFPKEHDEIATLAHEAVHGVAHIFDQIGERLDGEAFAHSVGAVVRIVLESNDSVGKSY
jgi:hypothetical protein